MAYKNKKITNPHTGQTIEFLQTSAETGGEFLEMETSYRTQSKEPPLHYHPVQEEKFSVVSGELTVKLNGELKKYAAGEKFTVPANTPHAMWNELAGPTVVNWIITPALTTEAFFETTMGLAMDGKTNKKGMPNFLQLAVIANSYDGIFRLSKPPFLIQKVLFTMLAPFGYLAGYKSNYKKYSN